MIAMASMRSETVCAKLPAGICRHPPRTHQVQLLGRERGPKEKKEMYFYRSSYYLPLSRNTRARAVRK